MFFKNSCVKRFNKKLVMMLQQRQQILYILYIHKIVKKTRNITSIVMKLLRKTRFPNAVSKRWDISKYRVASQLKKRKII